MSEWERIEKIINNLPHNDIIKYILSIEEELECCKEDNLYQLKQNRIQQKQLEDIKSYIKNSNLDKMLWGKELLKILDREEQ